MVKIYFRHEKPRPFQRQFMADIYSAIARRRNFMANAPTGSGKTDSALSAAVSFALENKKDVFFLTPKISQHKIAIETVCGLGEKHSLPVRAVDLIGRRLACIHPEISKLEGEGFYHFCALKRKKAGCAFHNNISGKGLGGKEGAENGFNALLRSYGHGKTHAEIIETGRKNEFCPYELMMKTGSVSNVIVGDYFHFIVPAIRESVLNKTGKRIENCIVILDEAHNLAARVRDYLSSSTGTFTLRRVEKELRIAGYKPPPLAERFEEWAGNIMGGKGECTTGKEEFYDFLS
ncbi:DEAD/DEAH box helicase family protein, partial [Candidatus Micrarchaeota archaeon]|nr:DEAD/DEAH box helicase family protein [Candidatus Micrarchaeota archaeon]